jgi:hypothetical protein
MYLGTLVRLRYTTYSYKNKKRTNREPIVFPNAFEAIITQELWDKCRELDESVSHGKHTSWGIMPPLSGLMFCADCGGKMKLGRQDLKPSKAHPEKRFRYHYICGNHSRFGKYFCYNHYIRIEDIERIVLDDIRAKARLIVDDEQKMRKDFLKHKEQISTTKYKADKKAFMQKKKRYEELERLTQSVYEDKVIGKIPEDICLKLLAKYTEEESVLKIEINELENRLSVVSKNESDVDEFIRRLKRYTDIPELTRELCLELIEYITIGANPDDKTGAREIHIYYKLLENHTNAQ